MRDVIAGASALAWLAAGAAGQGPSDKGPARVVWAAQPVRETAWTGSNRPVTHIADILRRHAGQASWEQPVMLTRDFDGRYLSLAPGEKTPRQFYADDRVFGWVYGGQVRISIEGQAPVVAGRGMLFDVAPRLAYSMENVGTSPAVVWRVTPAGQLPSYPDGETPRPVAGWRYVRAKMTSTGGYEPGNQPFLDFAAYAAGGGKSRDFALDGHTSAHVIRSKAAETLPPDTDWGHFHANMVEAWVVLEGGLSVRISGTPLVTGAVGDVIVAPEERWHRAGCTPGLGPCTRLAMTPRNKDGQVHFTQSEGAGAE